MRTEAEIKDELERLKQVHQKMKEDYERNIYSNPRTDKTLLSMSKTVVAHLINKLEWVLEIRK